MMRRLLPLAAAAGLVASGVAVGTQFASGAAESTESVFISITPCRLVDTRPDTPANPNLNVGPQDTKIGEDEAATFTAWGSGDADSPCDIPAIATAIATNIVAISPTARSFMTLYPADVDNPGTANLNFVAGQAPTPNSANVPLSPTGTFNVFNAFGDVHVVIDVNGYYQPSSNVGAKGPTGPQGNPGRNGVAGAPGPDADNGVPNRITDQQIAELAWYDDPADPRTLSIGPGPRSITSDGTNLFVTNSSDGVIVIDTSTNQLVDADPSQVGPRPIALAVGADPRGIAFANGSVYTANAGDDTVSVIDPVSLALDGAPIALAASSTPLNLAGTDTHVVVTLQGTDQVAVIDIATRDVTTVDVDVEPDDVVIVGDEAWVGHSSGTIRIVDLTDLAATPGTVPTPDPGDVRGMVSTGSHVWALMRFNDGTNAGAYKIDVESRSFADLNAGPPMALLFSDDVRRITYDGRWLYVSDVGSVGVTIIDPTTNTVVGVDSTDAPDQDIYFDGTNVWTSSGFNAVSRLLPR